MMSPKLFLLFPVLFLSLTLHSESPNETWRKILEENSECVTWVSASVRIEISANGRSYPPSERNIEALGTILDASGMTVLSLNQLDPTDSIQSKIRNYQADIKVNYTEVKILLQDGSEIPAEFVLKDDDLDLAYIIPQVTSKEEEIADNTAFAHVRRNSDTPPPQVLDGVVSLGKLGPNLYRQSTLLRGWVNAVIRKPRDYFVIENVSPGTPVFDEMGNWLGVSLFKKDMGRPSGLITLPAGDILEIAEQVRLRR